MGLFWREGAVGIIFYFYVGKYYFFLFGGKWVKESRKKGGNYGIRTIWEHSIIYLLEEDSTNNPLANTP
jgi:hypothetical protein